MRAAVMLSVLLCDTREVATTARSYKYEAVRITDLVTLEGAIRDTDFESCLILGPAVLLLDDVTIQRCAFVTDVPERIFVEWSPKEAFPSQSWPIGFIPIIHSKFVGCEFRRITFAGPPALGADLIRESGES